MAHPDSDDDALSWAGDDDATLAPGWKRVGAAAPVESAQDGSDASEATSEAEAGERGARRTDADAAPGTATAAPTDEPSDAGRQTGSVELVALGVLGGVYLLYAVGWLIVATTAAPDLRDPVAGFMYGLGRWFAALAPVLWFGAVLWLTAGHRRARLLWLIAGAVVLVPLPFLLRG